MKKLYPLGQEISMGVIFGYCSGYFSRKISEKVAFVIGGSFIGL